MNTDRLEKRLRREIRAHRIDSLFSMVVPAIVVLSVLAMLGWAVGLGFLWLVRNVWVGFAVIGVAFELLVALAMGWTVWQLGRNNNLW